MVLKNFLLIFFSFQFLQVLCTAQQVTSTGLSDSRIATQKLRCLNNTPNATLTIAEKKC